MIHSENHSAIAVLVISLALSACASGPASTEVSANNLNNAVSEAAGLTPINNALSNKASEAVSEITETKLSRIKAGKTRKEELLSTLGMPHQAALGNSGESMLWKYTGKSGEDKFFMAQVGKNGTVKTTSRPKTMPSIFTKSGTVAAGNQGLIPGGAIGEAIAGAVINKALGGNNADTASSIVSALNGKPASIDKSGNAASAAVNKNTQSAGGAVGEALVGALMNKALGGGAAGNGNMVSALQGNAGSGTGLAAAMRNAADLDAIIPAIKTGKTTKAELISALGTPFKTVQTTRGEHLLWQYGKQPSAPKMLLAQLDKSGIVRNVSKPKTVPNNFAQASSAANDTGSAVTGALVDAVLNRALGVR